MQGTTTLSSECMLKVVDRGRSRINKLDSAVLYWKFHWQNIYSCQTTNSQVITV